MKLSNVILSTLLCFSAISFSACEEKKPEQRLGAEFKATDGDKGLETVDDTLAPGSSDATNGGTVDTTVPAAPSTDTPKDGAAEPPKDSAGTAPAEPAADSSSTTVATDPAKTDEKTDTVSTDPKTEPAVEDVPKQCQATVWAACRRSDGLVACDTQNNCNEQSVFDSSVAVDGKSDKCSDMAGYESCRTATNLVAEEIAKCDKKFQCTIIDIKLRPAPDLQKKEDPSSDEKVVDVATGSVVTPTCNDAARKLCHKGGGGYSCDTKYNCESLSPVVFGLCYKAGNELCSTGLSKAFCAKTYSCGDVTGALPAGASVQPSATAKPPSSSTCNVKGRDTCLSNAGGFQCYANHKCPVLVTSESNFCDTFALRLCLAKGFGQKCYQTSHCAAAGAVIDSKENSVASKTDSGNASELMEGSSKTSALSLDAPQPSIPAVRLDQSCFSKLFKICKTGGGGNACADQSLARYSACRR
jgi:hypothetical protein